MQKLSDEIHNRLVSLRKLGKSIPEISRETGIAKTTVLRHIKRVSIPPQFLRALKEKQGGSKARAQTLRENLLSDAKALIEKMSQRDYLFLLIGLYWGEGAKADFSIINSDPFLIQAFLLCLQEMEIPRSRLSFALRVHSNISLLKAKDFWSRTTGLSKNTLRKIEIIEGKKKGKLPHGMCRVRVKKGIRDRLRIQSAISLIGKDCNKKLLSMTSPRSSMDRTAAS